MSLEGASKSGKVVVIGGGIAGLTAAYRLSKTSADFTLFEASQRLGGVISTANFDSGPLFEKGPDCFITDKPWALELCKELKLEDQLIGTNSKFRRAFVAYRDNLHPIPEGFVMLAPSKFLPLIQSPLFTSLGKMRMALDLVLPRRTTGSDETLGSFVRRRLGQEVLDRLAQPLVGGIYTADPEHLSLRATMPRFLDLEDKYGSVIRGLILERQERNGSNTSNAASVRYSLFVSFANGMQTLVDTLIANIPESQIRLGVSVESMSFDSNTQQWQILLSSGAVQSASAVILAVGAPVAARILKDAAPDLSANLSKIKYASSVVINFLFPRSAIKHPLDGFGFVVPAIEKKTIIAGSFSSVKFPRAISLEHVVLRAFMGGALRSDLCSWDDARLEQAALSDFNTYLGISEEPVQFDITRWPNSMPQYDLGHVELADTIEAQCAKLPNLYLAGNTLRGVGIPDCIHSATLATESVLQELAKSNLL